MSYISSSDSFEEMAEHQDLSRSLWDAADAVLVRSPSWMFVGKTRKPLYHLGGWHSQTGLKHSHSSVAGHFRTYNSKGTVNENCLPLGNLRWLDHAWFHLPWHLWPWILLGCIVACCIRPWDPPQSTDIWLNALLANIGDIFPAVRTYLVLFLFS